VNIQETIRELQTGPSVTEVLIELLRTVRDLEARHAQLRSRVEVLERASRRAGDRLPETVNVVNTERFGVKG
jgi:hypothetical protein